MQSVAAILVSLAFSQSYITALAAVAWQMKAHSLADEGSLWCVVIFDRTVTSETDRLHDDVAFSV